MTRPWKRSHGLWDILLPPESSKEMGWGTNKKRTMKPGAYSLALSLSVWQRGARLTLSFSFDKELYIHIDLYRKCCAYIDRWRRGRMKDAAEEFW